MNIVTFRWFLLKNFEAMAKKIAMLFFFAAAAA